MTNTQTELAPGRVVAIAGPVIDVEFPRGALPCLLYTSPSPRDS